MAINREITGRGVVMRWFDARDVIHLADAADIFRDISPGRAAVTAHLHVAVIRPCPQNAGNDR